MPRVCLDSCLLWERPRGLMGKPWGRRGQSYLWLALGFWVEDFVFPTLGPLVWDGVITMPTLRWAGKGLE